MGAESFSVPDLPLRLRLEGLGWLLAARVALALLPLKQVLRLWRLEAAADQAEAGGDSADNPALPLIRETVLHHVRYSRFWAGSCMAQSFAAAAMLRRRDLPATLCLGTARNDDGGWRAHAWLQSGDFLVTGADPIRHGGYTRLAAFGARAKASSHDSDL
jgi:hypothetical protein